MKQFKGLFAVIFIVFLSLACKKVSHQAEPDVNGDLKFSPYGIGYLGYSEMNIPLNRGVVAHYQHNPFEYTIFGYKGVMEGTFVKRSENGHKQFDLDLNKVTGFQPVNFIFSKYQDNRIMNMLPTTSGGLLCFPSYCDSVLTLIIINKEFGLQEITSLSPWPQNPNHKRANIWLANGCPDSKGGFFIFYSRSYELISTGQVFIKSEMIHLNEKFEVDNFKEIDNAIFPYKSHFKDGKFTFLSEWGLIYSMDLGDLMLGASQPNWERKFHYLNGFEYYFYGDTMLFVSPNLQPGGDAKYFDGIKLSLIDTKTGNTFWEVEHLFEEKEDGISVGISAYDGGFMVAYAGNQEGKLLDVQNNGKVKPISAIKGDLSPMGISALGLAGDYAYLYGFTGRGNGQKLDCFERRISLK